MNNIQEHTLKLIHKLSHRVKSAIRLSEEMKGIETITFKRRTDEDEDEEKQRNLTKRRTNMAG